jgi:hypothetical protein
MDPIDRAARCVHDMLIFEGRLTCSMCLGLPDIPDLEIVNVDDSPTPTTRPVYVDTRTDCARCGTPLRLGQPAVDSLTFGGLIGECCEAAA